MRPTPTKRGRDLLPAHPRVGPEPLGVSHRGSRGGAGNPQLERDTLQGGSASRGDAGRSS